MDVQLIDFAHPKEIRTFAKGRQGRRDRDQRAGGEEADHHGG